MKRVSLADLSKQLKVSKTLISLVLNGKGDQYGISKLTQARVISKADEMGYQPNQLARGLRLGRSGSIGLIVADIANPFYSFIARHIEDEVTKLGYNLIICSSDENEQKETRLLRMLRDKQTDGVIVSSTLRRPNALKDLKKYDCPVVLIDRSVPKTDIPAVLVDNFRGSYEMTQHLIGQGHKRIGYISISPSHISTIRERLKGFKSALKDSGIRPVPERIIEIPFNRVKETADNIIPELVIKNGGVTALVTANNNLAVAVLGALRQSALNVPNDIAICSFDDIAIFRLCDPPVTACSQPSEEIASESVKLIMKLINKELPLDHCENIILDTSLQIRGSSLKEVKNDHKIKNDEQNYLSL